MPKSSIWSTVHQGSIKMEVLLLFLGTVAPLRGGASKNSLVTEANASHGLLTVLKED